MKWTPGGESSDIEDRRDDTAAVAADSVLAGCTSA